MGIRTFDYEHIVQIQKRKKTAAERKQIIGRYFDEEKFCGLLDHLPLRFSFEISAPVKDIKGVWAKEYLIGKDDDSEALKNPVWLNLKKHICMTSASLFPYKDEVLAAIAKKHGYNLIIQNLRKEKVDSLDYELNKSREAIDDEFKSRLANVIKRKSVEQKLRKAIKNLSNQSPKGLARVLTKDKLKSLYKGERRTLQEIADEFHCSKQNISNIMKKYGLNRRGQSEARIEAIKRGKFEKFFYDNYDERFFTQWSPEMAWVLGLLFTDGSLYRNRIRLNSVDLELLGKVNKFLKSSRPIRKVSQSYDKSKYIYHVEFMREKTRKDLNKLGLQENKSLNMEFPDVPEECMKHFIRGCWDGDGSVFISEDKLRASYVCGSLSFIEKLAEELLAIGIYRGLVSQMKYGKKSELVTLLDKHPDGKFPVRVHKSKRSDSFEIKIDSKENLERLFHYFYDGVDESMYLTRKHNVFVEGLKMQREGKSEQLTLDQPF